MIKLSVAVMAHPSRRAYVEKLCDKLDIEPALVVWDSKNDRWDTGRSSLLAYDPSATHHFVIQDDAVVPQKLIAGVERMLRFVSPDVPISLYTGRSRPNSILVTSMVDQALEAGCHFLRMPGPWWGVGVITPVSAIREMVRECDKKRDIENYDLRMAKWWGEQDIQCLYSLPSLVDHQQGPSLVRGRTGRGRRAHTFLGENKSATKVAWTSRCLDVPPALDKSVMGDITAIDPNGVKRIITAKAFRQLAYAGWSLADRGKEVTHA